MIRRNIVQADRDQGVVTWSLLAAAFALSVGCFAEVTLARSADEDGAKVVAESAETKTDKGLRIAG
jgi:hypothetical protein